MLLDPWDSTGKTELIWKKGQNDVSPVHSLVHEAHFSPTSSPVGLHLFSSLKTLARTLALHFASPSWCPLAHSCLDAWTAAPFPPVQSQVTSSQKPALVRNCWPPNPHLLSLFHFRCGTCPPVSCRLSFVFLHTVCPLVEWKLYEGRRCGSFVTHCVSSSTAVWYIVAINSHQINEQSIGPQRMRKWRIWTFSIGSINGSHGSLTTEAS
jgi:hypothetical protein